MTIFNLTGDDHMRLYGGGSHGAAASNMARHPGELSAAGGLVDHGTPPWSDAGFGSLVATKAEDRIHLPLTANAEGVLPLAEFYDRLSVVQADVIEEIVPYAVIGR
jgi:hypothetical protein